MKIVVGRDCGSSRVFSLSGSHREQPPGSGLLAVSRDGKRPQGTVSLVYTAHVLISIFVFNHQKRRNQEILKANFNI